jgi:CDI immunity protein
MNEVVRSSWAGAICNEDFVCIETYSGYRARTRDPKGVSIFLEPSADDISLGNSLLDALALSRFVLGSPREGSVYPPELEFDSALHDPTKSSQRYESWKKNLTERFDYKSNVELFKGMKSCQITRNATELTVSPSRHESLESWGRTKGDGIEDVVIPANRSPAEIGAALRLAFSRCTE